eukprot:5102495-Amphidinium_carterae.1
MAGAKAHPDQQRRFAEAKAQKFPWTDPRTTTFILEGVPFAAPMEEPGLPAREGLGGPAPGAGEEADAEAQAEEPPPEGGLHDAPPDPEGHPATNETLALPTDTLSEFQDAEEGDRLEESPPLHSETRLPREIKEDGN